jgi:uncharacterized protein YukJ
MNLYEIAQDVQALDDLIESTLFDEAGTPREPTDEESAIIMAMICENEDAFKAKAENICKYRANLLAQADAYKKEEERLAKRRKTQERKAERLRIYLDIAMDIIKTDKLEAGVFRLRRQKNPPRVVVIREELIDAKYFRIIPETREVNKADLKKDFIVGEYPWGAVVQDKSLRIE